MKPSMLTAILIFLISIVFAQKTEKQQVLHVLNEQVKAWNNADIETFMKTYWNNDSLMFVGKTGVTYGYQQTMDNYKRNYSDSSKMGKLTFDILEVKKISPEYYFVIGKWFLKRSVGDIGGHYSLLFRKIKGRWLIVVDHSS